MPTTNSLNNESSEFTVDNIFLDGNTISTLDTDGNLNLTPNGTGVIAGTELTLTTPLDIPYGGTNANSMATTNAVTYYDGTKIATTVGNPVLIQTQTASNSATLDFTTGFSSSFRSYLFEFDGVSCATDDQIFRFQCSEDGGSTWNSSSVYPYALIGLSTSGSANLVNAGDSSGALITTGSSSTFTGIFGTFRMWGVSNFNYKRAIIQTTWADSPADDVMTCYGSGLYNVAATTITGFRFFFTSGNIGSGTIRMFGIT